MPKQSEILAEYKRKQHSLVMYTLVSAPWALYLPFHSDNSPLWAVIAILAGGFALLNIATLVWQAVRREHALTYIRTWMQQAEQQD